MSYTGDAPHNPLGQNFYTNMNIFTAGNVVRGNQKLCMLNPYESFRT